MSYTDAMAEAYASADMNEVAIDTLEFAHPTLSTPIRIACGFDDYSLKLEDTAAANANQFVTFTGVPFSFQLPEWSADATPELQLSIDNVDRSITTALETASSSLVPITVTYRPYLASDPATVGMDPVFVFSLAKVIAGTFTVTGTCSMQDVNNWRFPHRIYTPTEWPGLVR